MSNWLRGLAVLLLASCHRGGGEQQRALGDDARAVLERHCGECHVPGQTTTLAAALAVFDLGESDWARRMDERQLRSALWRLGEPIPPDGKPNHVTAEERALFARFVEHELGRRARIGGAAKPPP